MSDVTDLNALIERFKRSQDYAVEHSRDSVGMHHSARDIEQIIKALRTLAERQPVHDDSGKLLVCGGCGSSHAAPCCPERDMKPFFDHEKAAEQRGADRAFEEAAGIAEMYSSIHVEKRDDALADKNMEGALTKARQAQTCDEIAAAIRQRIGGQ